ncbi:MAG: host attachment protein [Gammaproteobacteria bacterium]|nr:MAG: host attachment protein [Gammaproteobacteria bacterium]
MITRIVVADHAGVRFFDASGPRAALREAGSLDNPGARLPDRALKSDRPGRVFARAATAGIRRGAVAHSATGGERRPQRHAAEVFARRIVRELGAARRAGAFDRLILVAGPTFLGELRQVLPKALHQVVAAELRKDLTRASAAELRRQLPRNSLNPPL